MTIKRMVNGTEMEFVLTYEERINTYIEQQALFDYSDVEARYGDEGYFTEEECKLIAQKMRESLDRYGDEHNFAMDAAIGSLDLNHRFDMDLEEWNVREFKFIEGVNLTIDGVTKFFRSPKELLDVLGTPEELRVDVVRELLTDGTLDVSQVFEDYDSVVLEIVPCAD